MFNLPKLFDNRGPGILMPILGMASDLMLILGYIVLLLIFLYIPALSGSIVREALGSIMMLLIPGYVLTAALFPDKEDMGGIERTVLSFTFSIAITALLGFALNYLPWGVRPNSVIPGIVLVVLILIIIANVRRYALPEEDRFAPDVVRLLRQAISYGAAVFRADRAANTILALSILIALSMLAYAVAAPQPGEKYTEFYILGPTGNATNYTTSLVLGNVTPLIVGVNNHEQRNVTYDLVVALNDSTKNSTLYSGQFMVPSNQTWQRRMDLKPDRNGTNMEMEFLLYADGNHTAPYRELHLWINVTRPV